ncbi:MAG: hypothetical protein ACYDEP_11855 [Acidimicrobiales bacterium]
MESTGRRNRRRGESRAGATRGGADHVGTVAKRATIILVAAGSGASREISKTAAA